MKIVEIFSHRNGIDILKSSAFSSSYEELLDVLRELPSFRASTPKKTSKAHVVSPSAMNNWLDRRLCVEREWEWHPLIIDSDPGDPSQDSKVKSDYRKSRIEVEVQFGNVARYAYDVYKMAISLALDKADVGIQVVCTKKFASITGGNIAYFERARRELSKSRLTLIVPLVVIGIEPDEWDPTTFPPETEARSVKASETWATRKQRSNLDTWFAELDRFADAPFMEGDRHQSPVPNGGGSLT